GCVRVTHPCAGRQRSEDPVTPRLACIRPPASVHPEPGSNSPLSKILTARNTTNHLSNQQHHKPKCLFRILYPLKQTNVHSLSSLTRLSVSKNFMIMDQKKPIQSLISIPQQGISLRFSRKGTAKINGVMTPCKLFHIKSV